MIIGITGTYASGKGTIVEILKERGFKHYSVREFLINELKKRNLPINRDSMIKIGNELRRENSPSYIAEELYSLAMKNGGDAIIESLRTPGEVKALRDKKDFFLFSVDAPQKIRYDRAIERKSESDKITFQEFVLQEKKEMSSNDPNEQNLSACKMLSNYYFENDGTIEKLKEKVNVALEDISPKPAIGPRENYISWDEYFMGVAILSAERSKDPVTQVGACIVDPDKKIVGTGYNGAPRGIKDETFPWEKEGNFEETKYAYVCHAELNAILNSTRENLKGCTLYVSLSPCNECAKAIIQSGIKKVVYLSDKYPDVPAFIVGKKLLEMTNIKIEKLETNISSLKLNFLE
jgi:dCMP deaminase